MSRVCENKNKFIYKKNYKKYYGQGQRTLVLAQGVRNAWGLTPGAGELKPFEPLAVWRRPTDVVARDRHGP